MQDIKEKKKKKIQQLWKEQDKTQRKNKDHVLSKTNSK